MAVRSLYEPLRNWSKRECTRNRRGYIIVFVPEHPRNHRGGWVYEHRLVAERRAGRVLGRNETVHHINEVKTDNREENLFVCSEQEHRKAHDLCFEF
ncbi:MAG: HNH endonuclease [Actinobacteria bacterium]|nr:HNH endonuclease [Actinomycetota bacterium]